MFITKKLDNGIRIACEQLDTVRSVSIGIWVGTGSVKEIQGEEGISHFIEHMLFKGTKTRSASQIAAEMDSLGGQLNAFTSKECTCFYAKVMDEHIEKALDVLCDLVLNSVFDETEMEKEKAVVAEEILMMEDSPEDLVNEVLSKTFFDGHKLSDPILGTKSSVMGFKRDDIVRYMDKHYTSDNIVIAAAGHFDLQKLEQIVYKQFAGYTRRGKMESPAEYANHGRRFCAKEKDIEQVHICIGLPGYPIDHKNLYTLLIANNAIGGSMSSRLFQHIREEKGLAYSVYSYPSSYTKTGMFSLYAGTGASQAEQVVELMLQELDNLKKSGITQDEFVRSKDQMKGSYILGLESTSSRMNSIGKSELLLGKIYTEQETLSRIEAVTIEDIMDILQEVVNLDKLTGAFVGRMSQQSDRIKKMLGA